MPYQARGITAISPPDTVVTCGPRLHAFRLERVRALQAPATQALFNTTSLQFFSCHGKDLKLTNHASGAVDVDYLDLCEDDISCMVFDDRQRKLIVATSGGDIQVINFINGAVMKEFTPHSGEVSAIAYSVEDQVCISGGTDGALSLHDEADPKGALLRRMQQAHARTITCLCVSHDLSLIATGSSDGSLRLWDFQLLQLIAELQPPGGPEVSACVFYAPYPLLVSSTSGGAVTGWIVPPGLPRNVPGFSFVLLQAPPPTAAQPSQNSRSAASAQAPSVSAALSKPVSRGGTPDSKVSGPKGSGRRLPALLSGDSPRADMPTVSGVSLAARVSTTPTPRSHVGTAPADPFASRSSAAEPDAATHLACIRAAGLASNAPHSAGRWLAVGSDEGEIWLWDLSAAMERLELKPVAEKDMPSRQNNYNARRRGDKHFSGGDMVGKPSAEASPVARPSRTPTARSITRSVRPNPSPRSSVPRSSLSSHKSPLPAASSSPTSTSGAHLQALAVQVGQLVSLRKKWRAHTGPVRSLCALGIDPLLLTAGADGYIKLWDYDGRWRGDVAAGPVSEAPNRVWKLVIDVDGRDAALTAAAESVLEEVDERVAAAEAAKHRRRNSIMARERLGLTSPLPGEQGTGFLEYEQRKAKLQRDHFDAAASAADREYLYHAERTLDKLRMKEQEQTQGQGGKLKPRTFAKRPVPAGRGHRSNGRQAVAQRGSGAGVVSAAQVYPEDLVLHDEGAAQEWIRELRNAASGRGEVFYQLWGRRNWKRTTMERVREIASERLERMNQRRAEFAHELKLKLDADARQQWQKEQRKKRRAARAKARAEKEIEAAGGQVSAKLARRRGSIASQIENVAAAAIQMAVEEAQGIDQTRVLLDELDRIVREEETAAMEVPESMAERLRREAREKQRLDPNLLPDEWGAGSLNRERQLYPHLHQEYGRAQAQAQARGEGGGELDASVPVEMSEFLRSRLGDPAASTGLPVSRDTDGRFGGRDPRSSSHSSGSSTSRSPSPSGVHNKPSTPHHVKAYEFQPETSISTRKQRGRTSNGTKPMGALALSPVRRSQSSLAQPKRINMPASSSLSRSVKTLKSVSALDGIIATMESFEQSGQKSKRSLRRNTRRRLKQSNSQTLEPFRKPIDWRDSGSASVLTRRGLLTGRTTSRGGGEEGGTLIAANPWSASPMDTPGVSQQGSVDSDDLTGGASAAAGSEADTSTADAPAAVEPESVFTQAEEEPAMSAQATLAGHASFGRPLSRPMGLGPNLKARDLEHLKPAERLAVMLAKYDTDPDDSTVASAEARKKTSLAYQRRRLQASRTRPGGGTTVRGSASTDVAKLQRMAETRAEKMMERAKRRKRMLVIPPEGPGLSGGVLAGLQDRGTGGAGSNRGGGIGPISWKEIHAARDMFKRLDSDGSGT